MANRRIDMQIVCPFYLSVYGYYINCAPVALDALKTANVFGSLEERNEYIDNFCSGNCWKGCVVAQMLLRKYDEENGNI